MVRTKTPGMRAYSYTRRSRRRPIRNHAINRSFDRASIHQQKVNTQKKVLPVHPFRHGSDAPPTPTPTTRLAGRVRIIRASSSRACLFALERRRHHACIHPRASSCIIIPSITTSTQRATPTTRLSSTGRVRRHRTSDVTCVFRVFRGSTRARRPRSRRSYPASHANAFALETATGRASGDGDDVRDRRRDRRRETWWWGLVLIPRARRSSSRRRRCVGGADSIRACVRCHANPSSSLTPCARAVGYVCAVSSREGGGVGCARGVRDDGGGCGRVVRAVRE